MPLHKSEKGSFMWMHPKGIWFSKIDASVLIRKINLFSKRKHLLCVTVRSQGKLHLSMGTQTLQLLSAVLWFKVCRLEICLFCLGLRQGGGGGWERGGGGGERGCCTPPNCLPQPGTGSASAPSDSAASPARPSLNTAHLAKGGGVPPHCSVTWRH